ncbi:MAG: polynucleotide adenylyltransferase PcnB [Planctomycetota bacterium]
MNDGSDLDSRRSHPRRSAVEEDPGSRNGQDANDSEPEGSRSPKARSDRAVYWDTTGDGRDVAELFEESKLDPEAVKIVRRLARHGHEAYLVGGCVRDLLLEQEPKDFDVATSATPSQIRRLFRNCRIIGRRFKLAHIFFGDKIIEVSTFRALPSGKDDDSSDLLIRRDNEFGTPEEDAIRRDFTVNGLFYDVDACQVIDHIHGVEDIQRRMLRTIGDPDVRIQEDPVRILRAVKFAARLDLDIDPETWDAMERHRRDLDRCAVPRVTEEISRLLNGGTATRAFEMLSECGVLEVLLPEVAEYLGRADEASVNRFWVFLRCLDLLRNKLGPLRNHFLFGTVLSHLVLESMTADRTRDQILQLDWGTEAGSVLKPIAVRMNLSRLDTDRMRQMLAAQRRFLYPSKRRASNTTFMRRPYFADAFELFRFYVAANAELRDEEARWLERIAQFESREGYCPVTRLVRPQNGEKKSSERPRRRQRR